MVKSRTKAGMASSERGVGLSKSRRRVGPKRHAASRLRIQYTPSFAALAGVATHISGVNFVNAREGSLTTRTEGGSLHLLKPELLQFSNHCRGRCV